MRWHRDDDDGDDDDDDDDDDDQMTMMTTPCQVIGALAPLLANLQHLVLEKLSDQKMASSIPAWIAADANMALTKAQAIDTAWQKIMRDGSTPPEGMSKDEVFVYVAVAIGRWPKRLASRS